LGFKTRRLQLQLRRSYAGREQEDGASDSEDGTHGSFYREKRMGFSILLAAEIWVGPGAIAAELELDEMAAAADGALQWLNRLRPHAASSAVGRPG
jgi:hypothetical protein